jgi:CheY-like chemotaxis protein
VASNARSRALFPSFSSQDFVPDRAGTKGVAARSTERVRAKGVAHDIDTDRRGELLIALDLEATLTTLGFDVCGRASNPREAVELATSRRPDLVLMDVYLEEGCEGTKAAKWLSDACDIPVLFVTGHGDGDTLKRIRRTLPQAQLCSKPCDSRSFGRGDLQRRRLDRAAFQLPLKAAVEFRRHDTRDGARQFAVASLKQGPVRGPGLGA